MVVVMHMMVINMYLGKQPTPQVTLENSGKEINPALSMEHVQLLQIYWPKL